jgi:heme exporter protein A
VILGPNGAGKSTLLRLICTLSRPSSGDAMIGGHSVLDDPVGVRKLVGVAVHETLLYEDLTAAENLEFYSRLLGVSSGESVIDEMLSRVELLHRRNDRVGTFSRGMKQRLSIARAMLGSPKVLLLDEPFSGLDIKARGQVSSMLTQAIAGGATVLLTSHDPELGHDLGHRLLVLVDGKLVYDKEKTAVSRGDFVEEYKKLAGATK